MGAPGSLDFETWWDGQTEETEPGQALLRVFKGVLQAPETVEERGSTIAQGVIQFILADTPDHDIAAKFWVLWSDWIDMISDIPHGHEWHECLAHAFELIRTDKGIAGTENRQDSAKLPDFGMCLARKRQSRPQGRGWSPPQGPTFYGENATESNETDAGQNWDYEEHDDEELSSWKNYNYALSLIYSRSHPRDSGEAIGEIVSALEMPAVSPPLMDCRIWTATQWLQACSGALLYEMKGPKEEIRVGDRVVKVTGVLCNDSIGARDRKRWDFWKQRLTEIADKADELGIREETAKRIGKALKAMELQEKLDSEEKPDTLNNVESHEAVQSLKKTES